MLADNCDFFHTPLLYNSPLRKNRREHFCGFLQQARSLAYQVV